MHQIRLYQQHIDTIRHIQDSNNTKIYSLLDTSRHTYRKKVSIHTKVVSLAKNYILKQHMPDCAWYVYKHSQNGIVCMHVHFDKIKSNIYD